MRLIGFAAALILILATAALARRLAPDNPPLRALTIAAVGLTPGVAIWALGGLETLAVGAFLTLGIYFMVAYFQGNRSRDAALAGLAFSAAVLARMDAAIFIGAAGIGVLAFSTGGFLTRFRAAFLVGGVPALASFAHMAWRLQYYGLPLPLTYYAKAETPLELRAAFLSELTSYVTFNFPLWPLAIVAGFAAFLTRQDNAPVVRALALPFICASAYILWSGGDHMPGARVCLPLLGLAAALVLGAIFLRHALRMRRIPEDVELPMKTFRYSITYLGILFAALLVHHYFLFHLSLSPA